MYNGEYNELEFIIRSSRRVLYSEMIAIQLEYIQTVNINN